VCADEEKKDTSLLTLDRIFQGNEFNSQGGSSYQWSGKQRGGYTTLDKPAGNQAGRDLVWHDSAHTKKEILVPAHHFIPPGEESPLSVEKYEFSTDESKLLIYTNSKRVWRTRSRL
jgi:dipeptidyl-peptidase-4